VRPFAVCACLFLLSVGAACASGQTSTAPLPKSSSDANPIADTASLLRNLRASGARVEAAGPVEQPFLSVEGRMVTLNGEGVQVFEYPDAAQMEAQAAQISPTGTAVGTSRVHWIAPPHFFKRGRVLVLYVGEDRSVIEALEAALGGQFAGQ